MAYDKKQYTKKSDKPAEKKEEKNASRIIAKLKEKNYIVSEGKARNTVYKVNESGQESGQGV